MDSPNLPELVVHYPHNSVATLFPGKKLNKAQLLGIQKGWNKRLKVGFNFYALSIACAALGLFPLIQTILWWMKGP